MKGNKFYKSLKRGEVHSTMASQAGKLVSRPSESRISALALRLRQRPPLTTTSYANAAASAPLRKGTSTPSSLTTAVPTPLMSIGPVSAPTSTAIFAKLHSLAPVSPHDLSAYFPACSALYLAWSRGHSAGRLRPTGRSCRLDHGPPKGCPTPTTTP